MSSKVLTHLDPVVCVWVDDADGLPGFTGVDTEDVGAAAGVQWDPGVRREVRQTNPARWKYS